MTSRHLPQLIRWRTLFLTFKRQVVHKANIKLLYGFTCVCQQKAPTKYEKKVKPGKKKLESRVSLCFHAWGHTKWETAGGHVTLLQLPNNRGFKRRKAVTHSLNPGSRDAHHRDACEHDVPDTYTR